MSDNRGRISTSIDLHGYQPLVVDEDVLSDAECREALNDAFAQPQNWMSYLTREERAALARDLDAMEKRKSQFAYGSGVSSAQTEKQVEYALLGMHRAYAQGKYNFGRRIWYGDGVPWEQHSG